MLQQGGGRGSHRFADAEVMRGLRKLLPEVRLLAHRQSRSTQKPGREGAAARYAKSMLAAGAGPGSHSGWAAVLPVDTGHTLVPRRSLAL